MLHTLTKKANKHRFKLLPVVLVVLFVASAAVTTVLLRGKHKTVASATKNNDVVTYSTDHPDETKPDKKTYNWKGEANDPKLITLPTVQTEGFIQKVGVDQNKQIAVPTNVYVAGWFSESVRPGEKGLSVIDGHVTGRINMGIFEKLVKIQKGDTFTVELGSGKKINYKVSATTAVATKDAAAILFSQDPKIASQLNLITCTGKWDDKIKQYDQRLIVAAEAI